METTELEDKEMYAVNPPNSSENVVWSDESVVEAKDLPPVKYQKLDRDGQEVLVSISSTCNTLFTNPHLGG